MIANHLPAAALNISADQGWDDLSVGLQLLAVLQANVPDWEAKLVEHFVAVQEEENAPLPEIGV